MLQMVEDFRLQVPPLSTHILSAIGHGTSTRKLPLSLKKSTRVSTPSGREVSTATDEEKKKCPWHCQGCGSLSHWGVQGPSSAVGFMCPDCSRSFATKRGLGVHSRAKHAVEYHSRELNNLANRPEVKRRWTEEEVTKMAREEANIMRLYGSYVNMNQELQNIMAGRTLEAIKGKRRP